MRHPRTPRLKFDCHPLKPPTSARFGVRAFSVFTAIACLFAAGCRSNVAEKSSLQRFEFSQAQMGLDFRITLYAQDEPTATTAVAAAYSRIAELNSLLSDYDSDSELSQLSLTSGTDRRVLVGDDLWQILARGQGLSRESNGAFDLTIGPSVNLWRRARRQKKLPSHELLELMRARVGYEFIELDGNSQAVKLIKPDMRLDAGGIAKGYAMDEAMNVLRSMDISRAMIQGGGDMVLAERPPGRRGWNIQLTSNAPALLLSNCAMATSGDLFQNLEINGIRYSHIVDPRTGIGLTNRSLVHVIAPTGITADSFSTTLNILGPDEAKRLLKRHPDVHARITSETNGRQTTVETPEFAKFLE